MSDLHKEFMWYSAEISKGRRECERLWSDYSACRSKLDKLERERAVVFDKMFREDGKRAGV